MRAGRSGGMRRSSRGRTLLLAPASPARPSRRATTAAGGPARERACRCPAASGAARGRPVSGRYAARLRARVVRRRRRGGGRWSFTCLADSSHDARNEHVAARRDGRRVASTARPTSGRRPARRARPGAGREVERCGRASARPWQRPRRRRARRRAPQTPPYFGLTSRSPADPAASPAVDRPRPSRRSSSSTRRRAERGDHADQQCDAGRPDRGAGAFALRERFTLGGAATRALPRPRDGQFAAGGVSGALRVTAAIGAGTGALVDRCDTGRSLRAHALTSPYPGGHGRRRAHPRPRGSRSTAPRARSCCPLRARRAARPPQRAAACSPR